MAIKTLPDAELLRQLLEYDPETGALTWRERVPEMFGNGVRSPEWACNWWNSRFAGKPAFITANKLGYLNGAINAEYYLAHRVIWKMVHSVDPEFVDHIDRNPANNRLANLRSVAHAENCRNRKVRTNNTSGHAGISYVSRLPKRPWRVTIGKDSLGYFATEAEAMLARKAAELAGGYT